MAGTHRKGADAHDPQDDIVRMEAKIEIGRFGLELRRKDPQNPDRSCIPLLGIGVERIHTHVTIAASDLLVAVMSIHGVVVLDLRPGTDTKLRDLVTSTSPRTPDKDSEIHLIWRQRKDGNKELLCQVQEPRVYLVADVLWLWKEVVLTSMLPRLNAGLARCVRPPLIAYLSGERGESV